MTATKAFDLALYAANGPTNVGDGIVVANMGPPYATQFTPLVSGTTPGIVVGSSVPAATASGQSLVSGAGPGYAWTPTASSSNLPATTAQNQILVSGPGPGYAWTLQTQYVASLTTPLMDGTATAGAAGAWARGDHVHPTDTSRYAASNPSGYQTAAQVSAAVAAGAYTLPTASTSTLGGVMVDGSTVQISGGVISATITGGVTEAPSDGTSYFRNNGAWTGTADCGTF
jgi:hypothetical protein